MELFDMLKYRILSTLTLKCIRLGWRPLVVWLLTCLIGGILSSPGMAVAETVNLPLTIDYPLMRSLAVATAFTDPGESAVVLDENQGCRRITLSAPNYRAEGSHLNFEVKAQARLGTALGNTCLAPVEWEGYVVFEQRPRIETQSWQLYFETLDSTLYDRNHGPARVAGVIWGLIDTYIHAHLSAMKIDLAPPVSELKAFLKSLFPPELKNRAEHMLNTLRLNRIKVEPQALQIEILTNVDVVERPSPGTKAEPLAGAELAHLIANWEAWDAFVVHAITSLSPHQLSEADRQRLLDTLLTIRYQFISALTTETIQPDMIRQQFVATWKNLTPVFRHHLGGQPSGNLLGYLAFFTASDALVVLDRMGPQLGLEISREGLIRLAHLLARQQPATLAYGTEVDTNLRRILGLDPELSPAEPAFKGEELELEPPGDQSSLESGHPMLETLSSLLISKAWAKKSKSSDSLAEIRTWLASRQNQDAYLKRIKKVLQSSAGKALGKRKTSKGYAKMFPRMVLATAWQESCMRQFLVKKKKIVYLRSYNGSSVGVMQINERVWRGIYNLHRLRWNIRYNARAGCEILDLYVTKYIEKNLKKLTNGGKIGDDTLAQVLYAMYNGGPQDFKKFLSRKKTGKYYKSDKLFLEKYNWVKTGQWQNIQKCF